MINAKISKVTVDTLVSSEVKSERERLLIIIVPFPLEKWS